MTDFKDIYDLYFKDVYRYALSLCRNETIAEEITQEAFFKALKGIDGFKGGCKIQVWLCQIAKNAYFSYLEKEKRHTGLADSHELADVSDFEQRFWDKEKALEIHKALHKLEDPYKEVFTLRVFGELSFAQIAELFAKTENWARVTYHRAKLKIKEDLP